MNIEQNQVAELMRKMGQVTPDKPTMPDFKTRMLRVKLIAEELCELADSFGLRLDIGGVDRHEIFLSQSELTPDLILAYDANLDIEVVNIGYPVAMGLKLQPGWDEVQRSNMTKTGGGLDSDGKFQKGPNYSPPNLQRIIQQQLSK